MTKKRAKSYHLAILAMIMALGVATPSVVYILTVSNAALASEEQPAGTPSTSEPSTSTDTSTTDTDTTPDAETDAPAEGEARVTDAATFQAALDNQAINLLTLTADITTDSNLTFNRPSDKPLKIDLNGHNISATHENARAIDVLRGNLEITGTGKISANAAKGIAVRAYGSDDSNLTGYTTLTIMGDVTLEATSDDYAYGLFLSHNNKHAYGVTIDFRGKINGYNGITINGNIVDKDNCPVFKIADRALIQAASQASHLHDASIADGQGTAIYAAGYAEWQIGAANIAGDTGIGTKAGKFTFTDTKITANGAKIAGTLNNDGINNSGATFQIEDNANYARNVELTILGGAYRSENGDIFYQYGQGDAATRAARASETGALKTLTIKSGLFQADKGAIFDGVEPGVVKLQGGTYGSEIPDIYLSGTQKLVKVDGGWILQNTPTPTPGGDDEKDPSKPDDDQPGSSTDKPNKPSVPGSSSPNTGLNNEIYSPRVVSAVKSAAAAIIAGVLVIAALLLHRYTSRHHLDEAPKTAGRGNRNHATRSSASRSAQTSESSSKSVRTTKSTKSAKITKSAKPSAKSAPARRTTNSRTKSSKAKK